MEVNMGLLGSRESRSGSDDGRSRPVIFV